MGSNVLIIPDKFKGTLTASAAAAALAAGWKRAHPGHHLRLVPMSDGGDGFGELVSLHLRGRIQRAAAVDAARRPLKAPWWWVPKKKLAIVESAKIIGLAMLPPGQFHPFDLDTTGLGRVLEAAVKKGAQRCLIGIGGSATNDAGFGMARALGWRFLDRAGREISAWRELSQLRQIDPPRKRKLFRTLLVAVDVANPLLGSNGASRIYGPQKGLKDSDMAPAEAALRQLAAVWRAQFGNNPAVEPGSGAAGGLGFGLRSFLGATLKSGFDLFSQHAQVPKHLRAADLVLTGEGSLDRSTVMGKGVGEIARRARALSIPCLGIGGVAADRKTLLKHFSGVFCLTPDLTSEHEAKTRPAFWLRRLAETVGRQWPPANSPSS